MAQNLTSTLNTHNYGSEQQWLVTLAIGSLNIVFDKFSGGDVSAPVNKHRPGGMGPEISYASLPVYSDVIITKVYETQLDHTNVALLHSYVGNTMCTVTMTPLDDTGAVWGASARTYSGRLTAVKDGGTDSNSNAARMLEVDIAVETVAN